MKNGGNTRREFEVLRKLSLSIKFSCIKLIPWAKTINIRVCEVTLGITNAKSKKKWWLQMGKLWSHHFSIFREWCEHVVLHTTVTGVYCRDELKTIQGCISRHISKQKCRCCATIMQGQKPRMNNSHKTTWRVLLNLWLTPYYFLSSGVKETVVKPVENIISLKTEGEEYYEKAS